MVGDSWMPKGKEGERVRQERAKQSVQGVTMGTVAWQSGGGGTIEGAQWCGNALSTVCCWS